MARNTKKKPDKTIKIDENKLYNVVVRAKGGEVQEGRKRRLKKVVLRDLEELREAVIGSASRSELAEVLKHLRFDQVMDHVREEDGKLVLVAQVEEVVEVPREEKGFFDDADNVRNFVLAEVGDPEVVVEVDEDAGEVKVLRRVADEKRQGLYKLYLERVFDLSKLRASGKLVEKKTRKAAKISRGMTNGQ